MGHARPERLTKFEERELVMTFNSFVIAWATHTGWGKLIGLFLRHQREQSGNTPLRLPNGPVNGGGKMCQMAA
jgi:hypothetical protein